jgi:exocyst complex component 5
LEKLSDPDAEPLGPEPNLLNLCDEILAIVQDEGAIIGDVFPHPSTVIQVFLQRIFQQSVLITFKDQTNPRSKVVSKV